jgi:hypothetical protein
MGESLAFRGSPDNEGGRAPLVKRIDVPYPLYVASVSKSSSYVAPVSKTSSHVAPVSDTSAVGSMVLSSTVSARTMLLNACQGSLWGLRSAQLIKVQCDARTERLELADLF